MATFLDQDKFLDHAVHNRLYPLYLLIAHRVGFQNCAFRS